MQSFICVKDIKTQLLLQLNGELLICKINIFYSKPIQTPIKCLTKHEMNVNAYTHTKGQTQTHTLTVTSTYRYKHYV